MKKLISFFSLVLSAAMIMAQPGTKPAAPKTTTKPVVKPAAPVMKNIIDSASYAIGMNVGTFYQQQGITNLNANMVIKGITDIMNKKTPLFDDATSNRIMTNLMNAMQEKQAEKEIKEGEAFLRENKKRPEVKTTASGLQYEILKDTVGYKPIVQDTFVVHYRGRLLSGVEFDNSYNRGSPLEYPLGRVIPGWTEALQLMSIGSKYKIYVPYQIGYGLYGNGPTIPGGAMLIFEMELLDVKKFKDPNKPAGQ